MSGVYCGARTSIDLVTLTVGQRMELFLLGDDLVCVRDGKLVFDSEPLASPAGALAEKASLLGCLLITSVSFDTTLLFLL